MRLILITLIAFTIAGVTGGPAPGEATFPGGNGRIAFWSNRGDIDVYSINPDGTDEQNLTQTPDPGFDEEPDWSRDGSKVAFMSSRDGNFEIYIMDADGGNQTRLPGHSEPDGEPTWSPDGTKIAFTSHRDGQKEIYVMDADGANQTRCTFDVGKEAEPAWSPDGSTIAFSSFRDGNTEVYVMDADCDGTQEPPALTNLTNNSAEDSQPSWSPDGLKLAFRSTRDSNQEVYVMNANGSGQTNISQRPASEDFQPDWSPDGSQIAFASDRDGDREIFRMSADGGAQTQITFNDQLDESPDWQAIPGVGGIAELPDVAGTPLEAGDSSDQDVAAIAALLTAATFGALALGGAAWYSRRRWSR